MKKKEGSNLISLGIRIIPFLILIATIFLAVGYSAMNGVMKDVKQESNESSTKEIYATNAEYLLDLDADIEKSSINNCYQTILKSDIVLSRKNKDSFITYVVTIYNRETVPVRFNEITYNKNFYDNESIDFKIEGIKNGDILESKQNIDIKITFFYKNNILSNNNRLNAYLNLIFDKIEE